MRRRDREITDETKIEQIVAACDCCRLGFWDGGQVYIVPLSFGYEKENGDYIFYFHGAKEGRKIDLTRKCPQVGFEMDTNYLLHEADSACRHSCRFQSIIGNGTVSLVEDLAEKKKGLQLIMKKTTGKGDWELEENMVNGVAVIRLTVESISCKEHA